MIFKKLHADAKEPVRSTEHSAGLDVFAQEDIYIYPQRTEVIGTGLTFSLEDRENCSEWFIDMRVRSSLAARSIMLANGAGVIDEDYAGNEIKVLLYNGSDTRVIIKKGDKIAQMIIMEHLSKYAKGVTFKYDKRTGGLGSTS